MHVHLPKPLHGWREFIGEIGIIALGILIALAAEQLIERAHWQHKVEQATEALRVAIADTARQAAEQQVTAPCIDRQLQVLEARLIAPGPYQRAPLFDEQPSGTYTVRTPSRSWVNSVWRTATGEGVSTHLPSKRREKIDQIYSNLDELAVLARESDLIIWRLRSLALPLSEDAQTRMRFVEEIEELRGRQSMMALISGQLIGSIQDAGMIPGREDIRDFLSSSGTVAFCRNHRLPLGTLRALYCVASASPR